MRPIMIDTSQGARDTMPRGILLEDRHEEDRHKLLSADQNVRASKLESFAADEKDSFMSGSGADSLGHAPVHPEE